MAQQLSDSTITILLVDDEPGIRGLMRRMLEGQGYQLLEAGNGKDGIEIAAEYEQPIHLVVTDVVMPYSSGFDLVRDLVASHPETKVLYVSGYADDSVAVRGGLKEARQAFLSKPFTQTELLQKVRDVFTASTATKP